MARIRVASVTTLRWILFVGVIVSPSVLGDVGYHRRHINSVAVKSGNTGCHKKPLETVSLLGSAKACFSSKPLKLTTVLKMGKQICAENWRICSITDKTVQQLSWKTQKMPKGCFAFNYGKKKAAGYGQSCRSNLYFDGVLCCPLPGSKIDHHLNMKSPHKLTYGKDDHDHTHHHLNLVK